MAALDEILRAVYRKDRATLNGLTHSSVNVRDEDGRTPLMHAVLDGDADPEILRLLIDRGADVSAADSDQDSTALHFAASLGKTDIVRVLVDAGAAVDPLNRLGNTPLWESSMYPKANAEIIKQLLRHGADPRKKNNQGVSAFDIAVEGKHEDLIALFAGQSKDKE